MTDQPNELPLHEQYADDDDVRDWDADEFGHMADYATDDEPETEPA